MHAARRSLYRLLEGQRGSKVILYVTGDRRGLEAKIAHEVIDLFVDHLDAIGTTTRITLYLYTRGGDTLAAWSIANLLKTFCDHLEVVVPAKAHSAGTLISLAAGNIVMTKQGTLGPIDPSVTGPLNPPVPNAQPTNVVPVSVEAINGFVDFARSTLGENADLERILLKLADTVHPMVLGDAYRARLQIRMLGQRLLGNHMRSESTIQRIVDFLCSDSGSHDYTINRREAAALGLPVETPSEDLYRLIKDIYDGIVEELSLRTPFNPVIMAADRDRTPYSFPRALIESVEGGSHAFVSEGVLARSSIEGPQGVVQHAVTDQRVFEGWRHNSEE